MKHGEYRKVYFGNSKEKYTKPKVIEFSKVKPYYKKVNFHQTKQEKKIKISIIIAVALFITISYLGLMMFGAKDEIDELTGSDTDIEQIVVNQVEAEKILGFKTVTTKNLPDIYEQSFIKIDPINKIYKVYFNVQGENYEQNKNMILHQKKSTRTKIDGTIDGNEAQYTLLGYKEDAYSNYTSLFDSKSDIGMLRWYDEDYEYGLIGDIGIEGLLKFVSIALDKKISFNITNNKQQK